MRSRGGLRSCVSWARSWTSKAPSLRFDVGEASPRVDPPARAVRRRADDGARDERSRQDAPGAPADPRDEPPSFFERLRAAWREIRDPRHAPVPWRSFDPDHPGIGQRAFRLHALRAERSGSHRGARRGARGARELVPPVGARPSGVSRAREPQSRAPMGRPDQSAWSTREGEAIANVASAISVGVRSDASPSDVKTAIRKQLERNAHWGVWDTFRLLGFLGGLVHAALRDEVLCAARPLLGGHLQQRRPVRGGRGVDLRRTARYEDESGRSGRDQRRRPAGSPFRFIPRSVPRMWRDREAVEGVCGEGVTPS